MTDLLSVENVPEVSQPLFFLGSGRDMWWPYNSLSSRRLLRTPDVTGIIFANKSEAFASTCFEIQTVGVYSIITSLLLDFVLPDIFDIRGAFYLTFASTQAHFTDINMGCFHTIWHYLLLRRRLLPLNFLIRQTWQLFGKVVQSSKIIHQKICFWIYLREEVVQTVADCDFILYLQCLVLR